MSRPLTQLAPLPPRSAADRDRRAMVWFGVDQGRPSSNDVAGECKGVQAEGRPWRAYCRSVVVIPPDEDP